MCCINEDESWDNGLWWAKVGLKKPEGAPSK